MDQNNKKYITCPYCGYEDEDSWEFEDEEGVVECESCGKGFNVTQEITVTYSSSKIRCDEGGHKYKTIDYFIKKNKFVSEGNWKKLDEKDWIYYRIEECEICDDKQFIVITKKEYEGR